VNPVSRIGDRLLGTALAVAAADPDRLARGHGARGPEIALLVVLGAIAWWAAPMTDDRPTSTALRPAALARRRRNTLLPAGAVVVAALTDPPVWDAACVTALLAAYLLATDAWTNGVTAPPPRGPRPAAAAGAAAACAAVFLAARVPLHGTSWARLPAALAVTATVACLALALGHRADRGEPADPPDGDRRG
jgi:hypothetical protein